jgi:hypothetical protein
MYNYNVKYKEKGEVEISDVCADGKYVKINKKGSKEMVLRGWKIISREGELEN